MRGRTIRRARLAGNQTRRTRKLLCFRMRPSFLRGNTVFTAQSPRSINGSVSVITSIFWRVKRPSDVTVRLEYRQEKLHEHTQAQEITYGNVRGTHKTEFKVIGDDYFDDGRVIAWRCLLIANGRIVAENRSFLWE